jgi:hypothetical protein
MSDREPPLTPEQRRRLIEAPITFHTYGGCGHAGSPPRLVPDHRKGRVYLNSAPDDAWYGNDNHE